MAAPESRVNRKIYALESPIDAVVDWGKTQITTADWSWIDFVGKVCPGPRERMFFWNLVNEIDDWEAALWLEHTDRVASTTVPVLRNVLISILKGSVKRPPVLVLSAPMAAALVDCRIEVIRLVAPDSAYLHMTPVERGLAGGVNYADCVGSWRRVDVPHTLLGRQRFVRLA